MTDDHRHDRTRWTSRDGTTGRHALDAHLPGDIAMWVMVLGDFVFFGAYFIIFMIHRAMAPERVPGSPSST